MISPTRIHPLTGDPISKTNGKMVTRSQLSSAMNSMTPFQKNRIAQLTFDAARSGTDLDNHWKFSDSLDPDSTHSQQVRHTLIKRSRYEQGSNGIYDGIITTHCNMLIGIGPTLRMLTGNRDFNQLVEREFFKWMQATKLRRTLWAMCHARTGDGESFAVLQNNPGLKNYTQLDVLPIEAEQCQTPLGNVDPTGIVDGIHYDEFNNISAYDILPYHPGASLMFFNQEVETIPASSVVHWYKLKRPGAHRGIPDCTSSLGVGASSRRHREATVAAAETAANYAAVLQSQLSASGSDEPDPVAPFTSIESEKRMLMTLPMGWTANQMRSEHPNATYSDFHRLQVSETARPLSMPYNAAACDSSTYSFASGKLDTLCYRAALDVERQDCNDLVLDPIFAAWFREWTILSDRRDIPPTHQWDWPTHPVIDAVAEATSTDINLKNGSTTMRQVCSDQGQDFEDQLSIMAEDMFGEATEENIQKCRHIVTLKNTPSHAIPFVAKLLGIEVPESSSPASQPGFQPQPEGAAA